MGVRDSNRRTDVSYGSVTLEAIPNRKVDKWPEPVSLNNCEGNATMK